ncbi:uncharacterized protein CC84DRAFT_492243 [Paraphaeosphaeria sporulosa]|uniref:Secreted protein n=1 Tax=Paraphaeosphaeria sporulosa TaxID=1460663 RepID=A0A177CT52_9PLEO|nr:uncharacterized protein CC84DRAFT_492243 [Paraphaeosphaeria sporulosa]OAG10715.1 hypothetical protein CC84DRAFT_492243 [Paraphaeosphaeria sporulosa]
MHPTRNFALTSHLALIGGHCATTGLLKSLVGGMLGVTAHSNRNEYSTRINGFRFCKVCCPHSLRSSSPVIDNRHDLCVHHRRCNT